MNKIVLVGSFETNEYYVYSLINRNINIDEIIFIDEKQENFKKLLLNVKASFFKSNVNIKLGDYTSCRDASILVITGKQDINTIKCIVESAKENNFSGLYLLGTDDVNIDCYYTYNVSLEPTHKVIGIGTISECNYLNNIIGSKLHISSNFVSSYVLGDKRSYVVPFNISNIGVANLDNCLDVNELSSIEEEFLKTFVNTSYLKASALGYLTDVIFNNKNEVLAVSSYDVETGIYVSIPAIVDRSGVREVIYTDLDENNLSKMYDVIKLIKNAIK